MTSVHWIAPVGLQSTAPSGSYSLGQPGRDSRAYVRDLASPRVCVLCKMENLAIGHTDLVEQTKRLNCRCVSAD